MGIAYDQNTLAAAEVCFAQASQLLYCEPSAEAVAVQMTDRPFREAPFGGDNAQVQRGMQLMDAWCVAAAGEQGTEDRTAGDSADFPTCDSPAFVERVAALKREWFRLFVGAGTPDAPCWESFYLDPNSQLFGKSTLEVRACYQRHGLQIEKLHTQPDDHLGLMLGFVGYLVGCEAEARASGDDAAACEAAAEQEAFLVEHVLPWLAAWHYHVEEHAASDYFRGLGQFVFGLCASYASRFGVRYDETTHTFKRAQA